MNLQVISSAYFIVFLLFLIVVAIWAAKKNKSGNSGVAEEHFLGGKSTPLFVLAMSYCASAVSAGSFIGDPALVSVVGWPYYWFAVFLVPGLVIPGLWIIRKMRIQSEKYGVMTSNEYLGARFKSPFLQVYIALIMVSCYSIVLIAQFKGAAILLEKFTGLSFNIGIVVIAAVVLFYTNAGGLRSVAWTDFFQGILMCVLCIVLVSTALIKVGGFTGLENSLAATNPEMLYIVQPDKGADVTSLGVFGFALWSFFIMFSQPYITSRYIALKEVSRKSVGKFLMISLVTGFLFNLMFTNGLTGRVLFPNAEADYISVTLASELIHPIFSGLMMIGFFSAIISTATSVLLVISQGAGRDIYGKLVKNSTGEGQIKVGNIVSVLVIVGVVVGNLYKTPEFLQIFLLLGMTGVGAAVCMPLFCGVMWDKATKEGAIASAIVGPASVLVMNVMDVGWAWSMGACVLWAAAAMFIVSFIVHKTKGVDEDLVEHARI